MANVAITQAGRWLSLDTAATPLGADVLVPTAVDGREGMSSLFEFRIMTISQKEVIAPQDLLGKSVTIGMATPGEEPRYVNGIVTAMSGGRISRDGLRSYDLVLSPSLWMLDRKSDYKVFQDKTVKEIAEAVLGNYSVEFKTTLTASYKKREYCIQYGETDLVFLLRLFAEEGIFFFFLHEKGKHTLVIADNVSAYVDAAQPSVTYYQDFPNASNSVSELHFGTALIDAKWTLAAYDFTKQNFAVEGNSKTSLKPAASQSWEHYRFPAGSTETDEVGRRAAVAIDAAESGYEVIEGAGSCSSFAPGYKFTLKDYPIASLSDKSYVVRDVTHEVRDTSHFAGRPAAEVKPYYRNLFSCLPAARPARSPLPTQRNLARGPETALVVGPSGQDIHTDKFGRIRIQFHWDRVGTKNEQSSCFVPVAQMWAGNGWGAVFVPRIGMEVVVHFLDGNPDRPLVTGAIYTAINQAPWTLPDNMTKSGLMTRSTLQGATANASELSFDDKKGSEKVLFHAEKDFVREVENDDTLTVDHDQTRTIKNNRTTTISEGNDALTVSKGNRTQTISEGNETIEISKGNRSTTIGQGNETLKVSAGNRETTLTQGNDTLTLSQGNHTLTLSQGNHTTKASLGTIKLDAMQGITLVCGQNKIEVTPQGITINGMQVSVSGVGTAEVKAPVLTLSGDGMTTVKGGMVKIN